MTDYDGMVATICIRTGNEDERIQALSTAFFNELKNLLATYNEVARCIVTPHIIIKETWVEKK